MKYRNYLAMVLLSMSVVACSKDDDSSSVVPDEPERELSFSLTSKSVSTSKSGGIYTVSFLAPRADEVAVESTAEWVLAEVTTQSDTSGVINITVGEYEVGDALTDYDPRSASIRVSMGEEMEEISVEQAPEDLLEPDESSKINSILQEYNISYEGLTSYKVTFTTNGEFTVTSPWWISLKDTPVQTPVSGTKSQYSVEADIVVLANYADESRLDSISFDLGDAHFACKFNQEETGWSFVGMERGVLEIAQDMKLGWTMGGAYKTDEGLANNCSALTEWMVDSVAAYNINVVRFPVMVFDTVAKAPNSYWTSGLGDLAKAVAGKGKYAIVTVSDGGWLLRQLAKSDTTEYYNLFVNTWREIAAMFDENDDHVIFESYGDYSADEYGETASGNMKRLNELFVQTVRRSGKNNYKRCLVIPFDARSGETVSMPGNDVVEGRMFTSCKFYEPEEYVYGGGKKLWGAPFSSASEDWSSSYGEESVGQYFSDLQAKLNSDVHGVPALLTEFGTVMHGTEALYGSSEGYYANQVALAARDNGFVPMIYDDSTVSVGSFGIFNYANQNGFVGRREYVTAYGMAGDGAAYSTEDESAGEE